MTDCWQDRSLTLLHAQLPKKVKRWHASFPCLECVSNDSSGYKKNCINHLWKSLDELPFKRQVVEVPKILNAKWLAIDSLCSMSSFVSSPAAPPTLGDMPPAWDDVNALSESAPEKSIVGHWTLVHWIKGIDWNDCRSFFWVKKMFQPNLQTNPFGGRPHSLPSSLQVVKVKLPSCSFPLYLRSQRVAGHPVASLWVLCQRLWEGSWIHSALDPPQEDKQVADHFGIWVAINMLVQIINNNASLSHSGCKVPPRKPKKGGRLPKKGKLVKGKFVIHTWGTIRPILTSLRRLQLFPCQVMILKWSSGVFGSTVNANQNFLSVRGSRVYLACLTSTERSGWSTVEPARTLPPRFTGGIPMEKNVANMVLKRGV